MGCQVSQQTPHKATQLQKKVDIPSKSLTTIQKKTFYDKSEPCAAVVNNIDTSSSEGWDEASTSDADQIKSGKNYYNNTRQESNIKGDCLQEVVTRLSGQKFDHEYREGADVRRLDPETIQFRDQKGDLKE